MLFLQISSLFSMMRTACVSLLAASFFIQASASCFRALFALELRHWRRWRGRGSFASKRKGSPRLGAVEEWHHLPKKWLKAYPDRAAEPLLKTDLKKRRSRSGSELVARPMGSICVPFAAMEVGVEALTAAAAEKDATKTTDCARCPSPRTSCLSCS